MKFHTILVSIFLIISLGLYTAVPIESVTVDDFPVGLLLDYTYTNSDNTCGFHYNVTGWTESPYNSSELVLQLHSSVTGDCLNCYDDDLIFLPSWTIYEPNVGSAWMRPLFTNTSDWYTGMDLKSSPVKMFYTQDEIQVKGLTTVELSFGSLQCWWVEASTDDPSSRDSNFFFDVEWGILLKYNYSGPYTTTHELYSTNIEFSNLTITETTHTTVPTTTTTIPTTPATNTNTTNQNSTGSSFFPDEYMFVAGAGLVVEIIVLGIIIRYIKMNR